MTWIVRLRALSGLAGVDTRPPGLRQVVEANPTIPLRTIADRLVERSPRPAMLPFMSHYPQAAWFHAVACVVDLPANPQGKLFLDVNIPDLFVRDDPFKYPWISVGWRLLDPRQEVVEPTRTLTYCRAAWVRRNRPRARSDSGVAVSSRRRSLRVREGRRRTRRSMGMLPEAYDVAISGSWSTSTTRPPAARGRYCFIRYPVRNIHAMTATQASRNTSVMPRLVPTATSDLP